MIVNSGNLTTIYLGFSTAFAEGFGQAMTDDFAAFTMDVPSNTRTEEHGWLGQFPSLQEWVGERVLRGIAEHGYTVRNRKFEASIEVDRDDIEDDRYGVYRPIFTEAGRAAAAHPNQLVMELLQNGFGTECYDGQYFFDTDHPVAGASVSNTGGGNGTAWFLMDASRGIKPMLFQRRRDYALRAMDDLNDEHVFNVDKFRYGVDGRCNAGFGLWQLAFGSKQELTTANYAAARQKMMTFAGDQGRPMGIKPTHLVVPPSLEGQALEVLKKERDAAGATNVYYNTATLIVSPWLI